MLMRHTCRWASSSAILWSTTLFAQSPPERTEPVAPVYPEAVAPSDPVPVSPEVIPPAPLDQGPDTLPSLDEENGAAKAPVLSPPRVEVLSRAAPRKLPIRAERRLALIGETGWNSLAGFGPNLIFHAHPQLSFELGVGIGLVGGKVGLRARYNLLDGPVTPFIGVGLISGSGFDAPTRDISNGEDDSDLNIQLRPSAFLQTVIGIDWTRNNGFTMVSALGYAWMLTDDNVEIVTGVPTSEERRAFDALFRSSLVISIGVGYSFR
jgi:hypothetical protein